VLLLQLLPLLLPLALPLLAQHWMVLECQKLCLADGTSNSSAHSFIAYACSHWGSRCGARHQLLVVRPWSHSGCMMVQHH